MLASDLIRVKIAVEAQVSMKKKTRTLVTSVSLLAAHLVSVDVTVKEEVDTVLVGEQLHGGTHLLKLLVAGVSGVPVPQRQNR